MHTISQEELAYLFEDVSIHNMVEKVEEIMSEYKESENFNALLYKTIQFVTSNYRDENSWPDRAASLTSSIYGVVRRRGGGDNNIYVSIHNLLIRHSKDVARMILNTDYSVIENVYGSNNTFSIFLDSLNKFNQDMNNHDQNERNIAISAVFNFAKFNRQHTNAILNNDWLTTEEKEEVREMLREDEGDDI